MYRLSTPTHKFKLPFDVNQFVDKLLITYSQKEIVLEKTKDDVEINGDTVSFALKQEETKAFEEELVKIQVRVLTKGGDSLVSPIYNIFVRDVLNDEVL